MAKIREFLIAAFLCHSAAVMAADDAKARLLEELQRIADASGGRLGVSALGTKSGERVQFNAGLRYPMASTFKVPLAMKLLEQVDQGAITLRESMSIDDRNLSPGSGELKSTESGSRTVRSVGNLLELMLRESDNTATDHLLARVGGPKAVTEHMRRLGIEQLDVSRPAAQVVADSWGFKLPPPGERTSQAVIQAQRGAPQAAREKAAKRFLEDERDTTTPDAMVAVLERVVSGKALSKDGTAVLLDHMENCRTGPRRIKGEMPRGVPVAHKTGTLARVTTNDIGIIPLPWGGGELILTVFLTGSPQPLAQQERQIAAAALAVYRYYTR